MKTQNLAALTAEIQRAILEIDRSYDASAQEVISALVQVIRLYFLDLELSMQKNTLENVVRGPKDLIQ